MFVGDTTGGNVGKTAAGSVCASCPGTGTGVKLIGAKVCGLLQGFEVITVAGVGGWLTIGANVAPGKVLEAKVKK